jgi:hypothetical protein
LLGSFKRSAQACQSCPQDDQIVIVNFHQTVISS